MEQGQPGGHSSALETGLEGCKTILRSSADGVLVSDAGGRIRFANPTCERLSRVEPGGLIGRLGTDFMHPDDFARLRPVIAKAYRSPGIPVTYEGRIRGDDADWIDAEITLTNLLDDPALQGMVVNFHDIRQQRRGNARHEAVAALGLRALRGCSLSELIEGALSCIAELTNADVVAVLQRVDELPGQLMVRDSVGLPRSFVGNPMPAPPDSPNGRTLASGTPVIIDDFALEAPFEGEEMLEIASVRSSVGVAITGPLQPWGLLGVTSRRPGCFSTADSDFFQAIANVVASALEREASEAELTHQALHDPLTGLPNRALVSELIEQDLAALESSSGTSVSVLFIDVDDFKRINDSLGHTVGDQLIQEVAHRLWLAVPSGCTLARFAGDEFVILVREYEGRAERASMALAQELMTALTDPFEIGGITCHVTASIGIATTREPKHGAGALLRDADAAMYHAKRRGRCRVEVFSDGLRARAMRRLRVEREINDALGSNELQVLYQPVVDSTFGVIVGSEALLRWNHPTRGLMSASRFIDVAEDTGHIIPIGLWVLKQACTQLARWIAETGRQDLGVSVNLSPRQLLDPMLANHITRVLEESGIGAQNLQVEITETMIVQDLRRARVVLNALDRLGVSIAIDDFGTGYSSLAHLKNLPVRCIKIDQSFITNLPGDPADRAIVASVSELTRRLGIHCVVEGVETQDQLEAAQALGCHLIQGYRFSRAVPGHSLTPLLSRRVDAILAGMESDQVTKLPGVDISASSER